VCDLIHEMLCMLYMAAFSVLNLTEVHSQYHKWHFGNWDMWLKGILIKKCNGILQVCLLFYYEFVWPCKYYRSLQIMYEIF